MKERDYTEELVIELSKRNGEEVEIVKSRLMKDEMKDFLEMRDENNISIMDRITIEWYRGLMEKGVTTKDMVQIMKLRGEDITKTQSVNLKLTGEAKAIQNTEEFLREGIKKK